MRIEIDPPGGSRGGYFSYLTVLRDANGDAIGALAVGSVAAPNTSQGG